MSETLKVYISSTFQDLQTYRSDVFQAIRELHGFDPVGMEDYVADFRPPLKVCLDDVAACDIYLCLIGSQYGSLPPDSTKSYTQHECEHAIALGKPRLVFILQSAWRELPADPRVVAFREIASAKAMCCVVNDGKLGQKVVSSLVNSVQQGLRALAPRSPVPPLLPYTCNRHDQRDMLRVELARAQARTLEDVPVLVVHGCTQQAVTEFGRCLGEGLLAKLLASPGLEEKPAKLPMRLRSEADFEFLLTKNIADALQCDELETREQLARHLTLQPQGSEVYFSFDLLHDYFSREAEEAKIRALVRYFRSWPERRAPRAVFVYAEYKTRVSWFSRMLGDGETPQTRQMRALLASFAGGAPDLPRLLPELSDVREDDALLWAKAADVHRVIPPHANLVEDVRKLFAKRESWEMAPLGKQLLQLLQAHRSLS